MTDKQMPGRMDGQTERRKDGWKKRHIEVGTPHKNATYKNLSKTETTEVKDLSGND